MNARNMKTKLLLLLMVFLDCCQMQAQKLTVESMTAAPIDLSASLYERKDLNNKPCALVKVQLAITGAQFEGNVMPPVEYKTNEYWVYMPEGSYLLNVKHPSFVTLSVNFRDYSITGVQGKRVYMLTLLMPQGVQEIQKQKLIINYTPATAIVLIDSKPYKGSGHVEAVLPVGSHNYIIAAEGYDSAEGSVKLSTSSPRTVTENLVAATQTPQQVSSVHPTATEVQPVQPTATNAIETITVNGVSLKMVRVAGGTFQMGSNDGLSKEKPVHSVTVSDFSIGETEVTQELWLAVMGSNPSQFTGDLQLPVDSVNWNDCQAFIQKLNSLTGRKFRLPTEAEWEYAARGGSKSRGYKYSGSNKCDKVAWFETNSRKKTHAVGMKSPNELGLYDMSGNVFEWCQDRYGSYNDKAQTNPVGPSSGSERVYRGGCWYSVDLVCLVSTRFGGDTFGRYDTCGLRLAF